MGEVPAKGIITSQVLAELGLPAVSAPHWKQLRYILTLPWFNRIWIIQEAVLSPRDPLIIYAGGQWSWKHLLFAGAFFAQNPFPEVFLPTDNHLACARLLLLLRSSLQNWDLSALLVATFRFQASDVRDKIFALLGLASGPSDPDAWDVVPDYEVSFADVYRDATYKTIRRTKSLLLLSLSSSASSYEGDENQPSWVPRYNAVAYGLEGYSLRLDENGTVTCERACMDASRGIHASILHSEDKNKLTLAGTRIDTVCWLGQLGPGDMFGMAGWWYNSYLKWADRNAGGIGRRKYAIIFFDVISRGGFVEPTESFDEFISYLALHNLIEDPNLDETRPGGGESLTRLAAYYSNKPYRLFMLENGLVGMGPPDMKRGDHVCVLFGGAAPFVLRPTEDSHYLIGECYVNGLMQGEAARASLKDNGGVQWFTLI